MPYVLVEERKGFSMTMTPRASEEADQVKPIRFIAVGGRDQVPAPLIRVSACGLLAVETIQEVVSADPPLARYALLSPEQLRGRGTAPALLLLKLLVSRPRRFALCDWLKEQFCPDREPFTSNRLYNLAWLLRCLLCSPDYAALRTQLVAYVYSASGSGSGYQLAPYPLIWIDFDALTWNVAQAARMERFGDDPLPFWERAYELARRGSYLPDELYCDWTESRREEAAGMLRQSVRALARLSLQRRGKAVEEEALLLLRSYWHEHPYEEDVLRPLMELLGRRECYQEALASYEKLKELLEEEKREPDVRTRDLAKYLRARQIRRGRGRHSPLFPPEPPQETTSSQGAEHLAARDQPCAACAFSEQALRDLVREATKQGIMEAARLFASPRPEAACLLRNAEGRTPGEATDPRKG